MASHERQLKSAFAHMRVNQEDAPLLQKGQFTVFDFLEHAFSFSPKRRQLAADVLEILREKPRTFSVLLKQTSAPKSALFGVLLSLKNSGLIDKKEGGFFELSGRFSEILNAYAGFWKRYVGTS